MANDRLRDAMQDKGLTPDTVADELEVSHKTVERWISQNRTPYPRFRRKLAVKLEERERWLWPSAISDEKATEVSQSEIVHVYPNRTAVPLELWNRLQDNATAYIDILVYVGMFMTEQPHLLDTLTQKAKNGARVRLLFGDRDSTAVIQRSLDEGIGRETISAKIDHALAHFQTIAGTPGIDIRTHETTLYNSIYRFDDEMIVNPHVYGKIASHAPALHLRRLAAGDLFTTYADSFTTVWGSATPTT